MKKATLLLTLISILMVSCTKDDLRHSQDYAGTFPTFYASFDNQAETDTKTYIDSKMKLRWTKGDSLSIFVGNTYNHKYKFDGETGANNGSFSAISNPEYFAAEPLDANYAVYPYNASNEMSADGGMSIVLPSVQKYAQNSFGLGANTMVAATENKQDNFLQFKNLCGYVVVKLYGEGNVTSIKLEGNNGEKISGKADVQAAFGTLPSVTMSEEATTSITLDCGEGVALGTTAESATEFWFCVPPVTFSKGFTVTATKTDGWRMIKSTSSSKEVVRNTKNALTPIEAVFDILSTEVVPPDDEIWYTTADGTVAEIGPPNFNGVDAEHFNVNVISNTYKNGKGIIKFDGPLTLIQGSIFQNDEFGKPTGRKITALILPESVETIWTGAFYGLGISEFHVPSNLQRMGRAALGGSKISRVFGEHTSSDEKCIIIDGTLYYFAPYNMEEYTIPSETKIINEGVFCNTGIAKITLNEGLEVIQDDAFYGTHIRRVDLPNSLKTVYSWAFRGCFELEGFYGNPKFHSNDNLCLFTNEYYPYWEKTLGQFVGREVHTYQIPEGVTFIQAHSFESMPLLREVTLPNSLTDCSMEVFYDCPNLENISGKFASDDHHSIIVGTKFVSFAARHNVKEVKIPDNVTTIGQSAFREATEVEVIYMGDNVTEINSTAFAFCYNLKEITLSANLERFYGNDIFMGDDNLENLFFRSPTPPFFYDSGLFADLINLNLKKIYVPRFSLNLYLEDEVLHSFKDKIEPYDYSDLPATDYYMSTDYSNDGKVKVLKSATTGNGVNVVLMGDAFSDRQIADGTYNNVMQKAVNALFSEEPYKSYKDYFNVYTVDAVSMTEGYEHGGQVFSTGHGDGTYVYGNDNKVFEYAQKALTAEQMDDALIIVMMNEDAYAGTCFMYDPNSGDYGRGPSIAYFPTSSDIDTFNGLVSHEAGGHGFAKLADEYTYEDMGTISDQTISDTKQMEPYGWYKNVDFTSDPTQVKWSKFLSDERYANEGLGCFEGGLNYWSGVWRPTDYSIMRYNTGGFNAPSREAIWYRIHKLAYGEDWEYNYEDFVAYDAINRTPAAQAASRAKVARAAAARRGKPFQPLHEPVVVKRSWKEAVNNPGKDRR